MQDLSDEELDGLFKEAAENHHVLHDPEAWQDIASRLDNGAIPAGASGYLKWVIPSLLLLAGAGGLLLWRSQSKPSTQVAQPAVMRAPDSKQTTGTIPSISKADNAPSSKYSPAKTFSPSAKSSMPENRNGVTEYSAKQPVIPARHEAINSDLEKPAQPEEDLSSLNHTMNKQEPRSESADSALHVKNDNRSLTVAPPKIDSTRGEITAMSDTVTVGKVDSSAAKNERAKMQGKRLYLQWGISPDFSSVHYFKPGAMGFNTGLSVGYLLSSRWSAQVGAVWAKKLYNTREVESGYGYSGYNLKVAALDGNCRVLDLSATVHYDLVKRNRSSVFLGAGLSSYMMMAEDYTYWCFTPSGNGPYPYDQHLRHANNDWFKMLDLSIGIDRQISRSISLQVEPFIKAPLSGVGEGKISLVSAGAFINMKWMIR